MERAHPAATDDARRRRRHGDGVSISPRGVCSVRRPRILFVQYAQPAALPPAERAAHVMHDDGWAVRVLGVHGDDTDPIATASYGPIDVRRVSRSGTGLTHHIRYLRFVAWAMLHLLWWRPHWVYVSDTFATPVGLLGRLLGFRVVYHEHDVPGDENLSGAAALVHRCRHALLRRASLVVTPNAYRSALLGQQAPRSDVLTVWNCPLRSEAASIPTSAARSGPLRLAYHGSIVPGRPPMSVIEALARASRPVELYITGYETVGSRGYVAAILDSATRRGVVNRITVFPPAPRVEILAKLSQADLGLALIPTRSANVNERHMAGASNKVFEYFAGGVPCLVTDLPEWRREFVETEVALACDPEDSGSVLQAIEWALDNRPALAAMGARGRARVLAQWNYETQFAPVRDALRGALGQ